MNKKLIRNEILFVAALLALLLLLTVAGLKSGAVEASWKDTIKALSGIGGGDDLKYFIRYLRLPRIVAALSVGACLAVCGVILQNVLNNPLASPFTLGISQGAGFGASLAIVAFGAGTLNHTGSGIILGNLGYIAAGAFCGSLIAAAVILGFSFVRGMTPQGLILAGVAISSFFGAATMLIQYFSTDSQLAAAVFWTFGDMSKGGWTETTVITIVTFCGIFLLLRHGWDFNAIRWGESCAAGLGVEVRKVRVVSLLIVAMMAAFATAFYGVIGFIGLIAPHMIRLVFRHAGSVFMILASGLFGGVFLLGADMISQKIMFPVSLPVGIVTAFTGVPVFLALLLRRSVRNA